jgi:hypothetical protein
MRLKSLESTAFKNARMIFSYREIATMVVCAEFSVKLLALLSHMCEKVEGEVAFLSGSRHFP